MDLFTFSSYEVLSSYLHLFFFWAGRLETKSRSCPCGFLRTIWTCSRWSSDSFCSSSLLRRLKPSRCLTAGPSSRQFVQEMGGLLDMLSRENPSRVIGESAELYARTRFSQSVPRLTTTKAEWYSAKCCRGMQVVRLMLTRSQRLQGWGKH